MALINVIIFLIFFKLSVATRTEGDLRVILCEHPSLQDAPECQDHFLSSTVEISAAPNQKLEAVAVTSLSTIEKILISIATAAVIYFLAVFFLKFGLGLSWRKSFSLATHRVGGHLCHYCIIHIYAAPDVPEPEPVAVGNSQV